MDEVLKFNLKGKGASFSKPTYNSSSIIQTYPHIHKVALLGILGAIIGIDNTGYKRKKELPKFYKLLKDLKIAIAPKKLNFNKCVDVVTDTSGFSNKISPNVGSTYLINYEILINPSWDIYILGDGEYYNKIKKYILNRSAVFHPFLGRNHLFADLSEVEILNGEFSKELSKIDSFFISDNVVLDEDEILLNEKLYLFKDSMPISIDNRKIDGTDFMLNQYSIKSLTFSNIDVLKSEEDLFYCGDKVLYFI
ncbi:TPA: type I-B CRISPR-associated protein Cas5 [Clostridioides difficile]|uniref:Type I-B CRISPR-associated protein Cas5 n=1 Tax=Clostridioides difficile TaxID=1496 RepID=A0AAN5VM24_CLODI|nr:type I-B CRISPR-associated protein Cas5b [Clostridioides difficile]EGT3640947.1 type I-B CRISPR-associated protein Cas5 [Clostridioides difficile]EGT3944010.1 type I-B CRISPR-associated protein Cas5 [Clostridioides difficile]MBG0197959.1 type I-B CRISPR-associated protein Cas5 [Clostridioides difficile]MBH7167675.1 type I-B CRISPR-associated protein Cas5 [Clostridioides difficile]MBH7846521.1 type I-B CRISPR-associated protein Cas5 [Clostridioides difficile]